MIVLILLYKCSWNYIYKLSNGLHFSTIQCIKIKNSYLDKTMLDKDKMSSDFLPLEKNNFGIYFLNFFTDLIAFLPSLVINSRFIFAIFISSTTLLINIIVYKTSYYKLKRYLIISYNKWIRKKFEVKKKGYLVDYYRIMKIQKEFG